MVAERIAELAGALRGVAGVAALNLTTGDRIALRADERFPTASAIKVFVLHSLYERAASGDLDLTERLPIPHDATTLGSGVLLHLGPGLCPSLADLGTLMMMVSDNFATNLLVDRLGIDAVNACIESIGLRDTRLAGRIDFARLAQDKSALGYSTPGDFVEYFARLRRGELLDPSHTERVLDVLRIQKYIEPLRRYLPADPYAREFGEPEPVWVASKTGSLSGVRVEAGLVHTRHAEWAIAVMTRDVADSRVTSDNDGVRFIAEVSREVYSEWGRAT